MAIIDSKQWASPDRLPLRPLRLSLLILASQDLGHALCFICYYSIYSIDILIDPNRGLKIRSRFLPISLRLVFVLASFGSSRAT